MADKNWKRAERRVAKLFGTERTPLSGGGSKMTRSDTLHPRLFIEMKYSQRHAPVSLFYNTKELAKREEKMPVVVYQEKGRKQIFAVVPLDVEYLRKLADELEGKE